MSKRPPTIILPWITQAKPLQKIMNTDSPHGSYTYNFSRKPLRCIPTLYILTGIVLKNRNHVHWIITAKLPGKQRTHRELRKVWVLVKKSERKISAKRLTQSLTKSAKVDLSRSRIDRFPQKFQQRRLRLINSCTQNNTKKIEDIADDFYSRKTLT